jgi:glycosyltransferase involved in cell wall biosynthesis
MTRTLDLGCGDVPRNPFHADALFGVDVRSGLGGNIRSADLALEPIPFADDSFDYLTAYDFIEHLPRVIYLPERRNAFVEAMNEVYRVLKPGGLFLAQTPAYPHAVAFRDPTHVNIITDETFPLYFDDQNRWASIYGFRGAFKPLLQEWHGPHLRVVLQKVASPDAPPPPAPDTRRISVFLPVHNGERFLAKTLDSVLAQTDQDFEVLCIDDSSTDGSAGILRGYAERDARIRLLATPHNLGSAAKSLNYALPHMTGAYFVYSSQDDLFSPDWLEKMRLRAVETGADAVIPDVVFHHEGDPSKDHALVGLAGDRSAVLTGREACQCTLDWSIPGNALLKAELVRQVGFEAFAINADEYSVRRLFLQCNKVVFCEGRFLYRQDNPLAVTKRFNGATFDWPYTQLRVAQLLQENGFKADIVRGEIDGACAAMARLKSRLEAERGNWLAAEVERAQAAIGRFEVYLRAEQVFAPREQPRRTLGQRLAKLKNSLRKRKDSLRRLAGKLGVG